MRCVVVVAMVAGLAWDASADPLEEQMRCDVAAASADAAALFDEGTRLRNALETLPDAAAAYEKALALAPGVDHLHRRLCAVYIGMQRVADAATRCEAALELNPTSPYNKSALANVLVVRNAPGDRDRAVGLAREGAAAAPDNVAVTSSWCEALLARGAAFELPSCADQLLRIDPDGLLANYSGAMASLLRDDTELAIWHLEKAKAAGLTDELATPLLDEIDRADREANEPLVSDDTIQTAAIAFGIWLALLVVLFAASNALSLRTLASLENAGDAGGTPGELRLRRIYKVLLAISGIAFYVSLPIVFLAVVAFSLGVFYIFDEGIGATPIYILFLLGGLMIATFVAVVRALFSRAETTIPDKPLDLATCPQLRTLLDEVAAAIGTRPVDSVYLAPGTLVAVFERGGLWSSLRSKRRERVLLLGVALFDGMRQQQLRAILAHEYGHFRNADTAGGGFALAVRRSLGELAKSMDEDGVAHMLNPAWWFVRAFHRIYVGISHGASRLQEILADRGAIAAYGSESFASGLRHIAERTVTFEHDASALIRDARENDWTIDNIYELEPDEPMDDAARAAAVDKALAVEATPYDSHPVDAERLRYAERIAAPGTAPVTEDGAVWELFADPEAIERAMTAELLRAVSAM